MNEEKLKKEVLDLFYRYHQQKPSELGLNGFAMWSFRDAFLKKQTFAVFAKDDETVQAYIKCQNVVHGVFKLVFALPFIFMIGLCLTFSQLVNNGNYVPAMVFLFILVFLAVACWVFYVRCKPLEKRYLDEDGLHVTTFRLTPKGIWQIAMFDPNKVYVDTD